MDWMFANVSTTAQRGAFDWKDKYKKAAMPVFEELYDDAKIKIDEIAERILTLRFQPTSNLSEYLDTSNIKESPSDISDSKMIKTLLDDHGVILKQLRKVSETAEKGGDEGTVDLMGAYIRELEKTSWMLDAWTMKSGDNHPEA